MSYSTFCAPAAVAAVADLTPSEAAAAIRTAARAFERPEPNEGTSFLDVARTLLALGRELQQWSPAGELTMRAGRFRALMMTAPAAPPVLPAAVEGVVLAERRRLLAAPMTIAPPAARLTVGQWLGRFRWGMWIIGVDDHVLALRRGEIIAGGDGYMDAPVLCAVHVLDTESEQRAARHHAGLERERRRVLRESLQSTELTR